MVTSGLRIGTPALATRGFAAEDVHRGRRRDRRRAAAVCPTTRPVAGPGSRRSPTPSRCTPAWHPASSVRSPAFPGHRAHWGRARCPTPCTTSPVLRSHRGHQRLRPVLDRHRPVQLAHGRPDARRRACSPPARNEELLDRVPPLHVELYGSLGATGHGHGSPKAVLLGLEGEDPETVDIGRPTTGSSDLRRTGRLRLLGGHEIDFAVDDDLVLHRRKSLPFHPNGMTFGAFGADGAELGVEARTTPSAAASSSTRTRSARTASCPTTHPGPVPVPHRRRAARAWPRRPVCRSPR